MANTTKPMTEFDQSMILQKAYNPTEGTLAVGSFIAGKLGHRIDRAIVSGVIDRYSYYDGAVLLYTIEVTYDNTSHDNVNRVERIA